MPVALITDAVGLDGSYLGEAPVPAGYDAPGVVRAPSVTSATERQVDRFQLHGLDLADHDLGGQWHHG